MPIPRFLLIVAVLLAAVSLRVVPASATIVAADKHPHPADLTLQHRGVTVPCDQALETIALAAGDTVTRTGATDGVGVIDSYGCQQWPEGGPEAIYLLDIVEPLDFAAWLPGNIPNDHDLVLLSDCDSDSCIVQGNTDIAARLEPGQYVLVIDGYGSDGEAASGDYDLTVGTRPIGVPDLACLLSSSLGEFAGQEPIDTVEGSLFEQPDFVSFYDCAPITLRGGEMWYRLQLGPSDNTYDDLTDIGSVSVTLTATPGSPELDLALWLFDGCGPDAVCLAFSDGEAENGPETMHWVNQDESSVIVYLAVDSPSAPDAEYNGSFSMQFEGTTPVQRKSLTNIRNIFR